MRFARFVAATALAVAATPVLGGVTAAPAEAAGCTGAGGVTVVVDGRALGGGVDESCVGSGGRADALFASAGHRLEYQPGDPGYVCYVDGAPGANCGRDKAAMNYWSLWWSDGTSGSWVYSGLGVRSLNVPDGGYVAWVWQNAGSRSVPATSAAPRATTPDSGSGSGSSPSAPSNPGSGAGGGAGSGSGGSPSGGAPRGTAPATTPGGGSAPSSGVPGSATSDPTGAPSDAPTTGATTEPGAPTTEPTAAPTSGAPSAGETLAYDEGAVVASEGSSDAADEAAGGSVPWWALGLVALVLAAGGGGVALARRRRSEAGPLL